MPEAAVVSCSRCGAAVERASNTPQTRCRYCGSVVEWPRPAVPEPPPLRPGPVPSSAENLAGLRVWALGLGVMALVVVVIAVGTYLQAPARPTSVAATASAPIVVEDAPHGDVTKLVAPDLHALDPARVIQAAGAAVRERASDCELTYACLGALKGGVVDGTTGNGVLLKWACDQVDPSKPPDEWAARLERGYLTFEREAHGHRKEPPWREPSCPFARAWAAAVASGVPANALVNVFYEEWALAAGERRPTVWRLTIEGHDESARDVDGATCEVLKPR